MYNNLFGRTPPQPWRDVMQVCLDGHVINDSYHKYPDCNKDFCDKCGAKTITSCPKCSHPIPGDMQDTGVVMLGGFRENAPDFCQYCGEKFPWYGKIKVKAEDARESPLVILERIFFKFHNIVRQLRNRYSERETLDINDEYDVQDLLHSLLLLFFDDIRPEEVTPSYAGKSARIDFLLKNERIAVEVKMTRKGLGNKEIGDQLLVDVARYQEHLDCSTLVCFVYDPHGRITNPNGLISDLQKQSKEELKVTVFIYPV
jgi:REase_DpnII-MboI/Uncharacterized protein conserved in bacteria (DUF2321)